MMSDVPGLNRVVVLRWGRLTHMRNVSTLANALSRSNLDVRVVTMDGDGTGPSGLDAGIPWTGLMCSRERMGSVRAHVTAGYRLARALAGVSVDLLYVVDSWMLPALCVARSLVPSLRRVPWIYHTFDWMDPGRHPLHERLERWACRSADGVVNVDRSRARMQQAIYKLTAMPRVVPNYLSLREAIPPRDEATRARLLPPGAVAKDAILLCYPTFAAPARLTLELITAMRSVNPNVCLVTFLGEDAYGRQCRQRVEDTGLGSRVTFHEGVPYARLLELVAACDIGAIFHDYRLSSGYYMCNADRVSLFAACGIPFVGSDYPNMESLVLRHGLGECCDPTDPAAIADALNRLVEGGGAALGERRRRVHDAFERDLHFERNEGPWLAYVRERMRGRPA